MAEVCPKCKKKYRSVLLKPGQVIKCVCGHSVGSGIGKAFLKIPIEGVIDLHAFRPSEVKELVPDYLQECRDKGIFRVRIIHGKGTGALKEKVYSILKKIPEVSSFSLAGHREGSWGATIVLLKR